MREEVRYYAFDDTEFFDREECEAYEGHIYDMLTDIDEKCSFFDKEMNVFLSPLGSPDIDDWIKFFNNAISSSSIIYRDEIFTDEEDLFVRHEFGYCFSNEDFNNEIGWFRWDENEIEWVKMGE